MKTNNGYTPESIANSEMYFSIPLYQRLFEWEREQILKLLTDLKLHFEKDKEKPYYIGMLTAYKKEGVYDLVDGQQRFTVLMLLGIAFGWNDFTKHGDKLRLDFYARPNDKKYLEGKISNINNEPEVIHQKMEKGLGYIKEFLDSEIKEKQSEFKENVYRYLTFFISELPQGYNTEDLNKYFERMNSAGRNLEKHEILKVELLKKSNDQERHTKIWNLVEQMDSIIVKKNSNESREEYRERFEKCIANNQADFKDINGENSIDSKSLLEVDQSSKAPEEKSSTAEGKRSIITFSEFLLLVLDITMGKDGKYEFYRVENLLETFKCLTDDKVEGFYNNLLKYRLIFDYYIVKIDSDSNGNKYDFEYKIKDKDEKSSAEINIKRDCIKQYQSMLYVSTPFYSWLKDMLKWFADNSTESYDNILSQLKQSDNKRHSKIPENMAYGQIERYWFWRLDYYLWEREAQKGEDADKIVLPYTFRANRSIEHLHPQDDSENSKWIEKDEKGNNPIHSFGNLAMISTSFNSAQSNDNINIKFARIKEQIEFKRLESLKMYEMYRKAGDGADWNEEIMRKHEEEMIKILKESLFLEAVDENLTSVEQDFLIILFDEYKTKTPPDGWRCWFWKHKGNRAVVYDFDSLKVAIDIKLNICGDKYILELFSRSRIKNNKAIIAPIAAELDLVFNGQRYVSNELERNEVTKLKNDILTIISE